MAIGYNADGVWTSVTYFSSGTPKGGTRYKNEEEAREEALHDLRKRGGEGLARAEILSSSDATGYVAVARGADKSRKDENVAGRGPVEELLRLGVACHPCHVRRPSGARRGSACRGAPACRHCRSRARGRAARPAGRHPARASG